MTTRLQPRCRRRGDGLLSSDDEGDTRRDVMHHEDLTMKAKPGLQLSSTTCRAQTTKATIYARKQASHSQSVTLNLHISSLRIDLRLHVVSWRVRFTLIATEDEVLYLSKFNRGNKLLRHSGQLQSKI